MDELQKISGEICNIFNSKIDNLTKEEAEQINIYNNSMNFYMQLGDKPKCLWNARQTLKYLENISENK